MDKPRTVEDANDKMKPGQLTEIVDTSNCRMVTMPDTDAGNKVCVTELHLFAVFLSNIDSYGYSHD